MEPEICTKMLRTSSQKRGAKFPATTLSYSMAKFARLNDAFSEGFELKTSPVEGQSLPQGQEKEKKERRKHLERTAKPNVQKIQIFISAQARAEMS